MEVFSTRQPIFGRDKSVYGYELLFRSGFEQYYDCLGANHDSLDLMALVNFGELSDGKKGLATFTRNLLLRDMPAVLPKDMMLVGVPGDVVVDQEVVGACQRLAKSGYELVVDGVGLGGLDSPIVPLANIVRMDFDAASARQASELCARLDERGIAVLARKVESVEQFNLAVDAGFTYFQGGFFTRPTGQVAGELAGNELSYARLLCEVNRPELSLDQLDGIIRSDPLMTYHLLKFINSAWFGIRCVVNTVRHALVLLGPKETRRWASMVVVQKVGEDKPSELILRSLTRAKVAEAVAPLVNLRPCTPELFLLGLFSLLDAMMDRPMKELLSNLPVDEKVTKALLGEQGAFRDVLDLILCYEAGRWDDLAGAAARLRLDERALPGLFNQAIKWANKTLGLLEETDAAKACAC
jgi:c-di-GMP-related signal transduction protein